MALAERTDPVPIRDAATIILWRTGPQGPEVLMGQRGAAAVFMASKVVFPGGAVDASDASVDLHGLPDPVCLRRLEEDAGPCTPEALLTAAVRELWEETGLVLGTPDTWSGAPSDWIAFAATGHRPTASSLRFVFRAVTPPGRPRRFDARFFLAPADALAGDPDDFGHASDELSHLGWRTLAQARSADLPFITQIVLGEIESLIGTSGPPDSVPFVVNDDIVSQVRRLR